MKINVAMNSSGDNSVVRILEWIRRASSKPPVRKLSPHPEVLLTAPDSLHPQQRHLYLHVQPACLAAKRTDATVMQRLLHHAGSPWEHAHTNTHHPFRLHMHLVCPRYESVAKQRARNLPRFCPCESSEGWGMVEHMNHVPDQAAPRSSSSPKTG